MNSLNISFIGGGNMAMAMCEGLTRETKDRPTITVAEPAAAQQRRLAARLPSARIVARNDAALAGADVVVLAVKPQILRTVCTELASSVPPAAPLFISVAAGPRISAIAAWLGGRATVVRAIPNQPALLGRGMTVLFSAGATPEQRAVATTILGAVGETLWVTDESLLDAGTAVSGSGPAYFYLLMEMLIDAAVDFGFSPTDARRLVTITALGAAETAAHQSDSLTRLRENVTSPGGTTEAALSALAGGDIRGIFQSALLAARDRGRVLAGDTGDD